MGKWAPKKREHRRRAVLAYWTPERREQARQEALRQWTPEARAAASEAMTQRWHALTPEQRQAIIDKSSRTTRARYPARTALYDRMLGLIAIGQVTRPECPGCGKPAAMKWDKDSPTYDFLGWQCFTCKQVLYANSN